MILTSKDIFDIVSEHYGLDIRQRTRKKEFIVMRSIAVQLSRRFTRETLFNIGANYLPEASTSKHTSIINCTKKFYDEYIHYEDTFNAKKDYELLLDIVSSDKSIDKSVQINDLTEENALMKQKLKGFSLDKNTSDILVSVIEELKGMTNDELIEFRDTRVKIFKLLLKSRK